MAYEQTDNVFDAGCKNKIMGKIINYIKVIIFVTLMCLDWIIVPNVHWLFYIYICIAKELRVETVQLLRTTTHHNLSEH